MARAPQDSVHPGDRAAWRRWLEQHHASSPGVWLVTWRRASGKEPLRYEDAVEEALCFGWVDSKVRSLDEHRSMQWFTRRRPGSAWARSNKDRVTRLERLGLMSPAGTAAVEAARADGSWTVLDSVEAGVVPHDLADAWAKRVRAAAEMAQRGERADQPRPRPAG